MSASSLVFAGIAPHPPIMVPEVGHEAISEVLGSIDAMRELTERVIESGAETIVIISPHAPLQPQSFVAYSGAELEGDFINFRAPEVHVLVPVDVELLDQIARTAESEGYEVTGLADYKLDHGTAVPLYFLQRNGWRGRVVALGYNFLSNADHLRFGHIVRRAADERGRPIAFIASGDLSHRLKPEAPAGFEPQAYLFDEEIVASLRAGEPERIVNINQDLRRLAGECGYRSMLVAFGAIEGLELDCEVLHYEAPFGVGYMVAQLVRAQTADALKKTAVEEHDDSGKENDEGDGRELPALARSAVETFVLEGRVLERPAQLSAILDHRAACFVSIKTLEGELRGCIGTVEPTKETLADELIANAIGAATRDPRFPPLRPEELSQLVYSIDILSEIEPATFEELDPKIYGVIVEDESGLRRGLLLPDIQGIKDAAQQVEIAARKAGLAPGTRLRLSRFRVERFREPARVKQNFRTSSE
ncbi:MAG TPA: AmmeMemoRadiSam system protein A [Pyrinomonadaceae bacterium]|jgi:AmmeMemoRadiSam system protein A/AmmeMemoRadiSam system protein B